MVKRNGIYYFIYAIISRNTVVTRIKTNTVLESVAELDLPEGKDQDIIKDQIIILTSLKAIETSINLNKLRLVSVYKEDENKVI